MEKKKSSKVLFKAYGIRAGGFPVGSAKLGETVELSAAAARENNI